MVERGGKNGSLKVTDSTGKKGGQQLLNSFVEQFALDLPRFMNQSAKDKAATLLRIIGVGDKLGELERTEKELYDRRTAIGRIADQKEKYAKEMPVYAGVPAEPVSAGELIKQQQEILARNGENQRKRDQREYYAQQLELAKSAYEQAKMRFEAAENNFKLANLEAQDLEDESTAELERNIAEIDELNAKIRANLDREHAEIDAEDYRSQYSHLTEQIADARQAKTDLLKGADLPLEGLSVEEGELLYKGCKWDGMSGAEQLVVATSIVRRLNPDCGFVLLDKLEQMDAETLADFGKWLEEQGLQAIATRVSTGGECSIIIEDGTSFVPEPQTKTGFNWNGGKF